MKKAKKTNRKRSVLKDIHNLEGMVKKQALIKAAKKEGIKLYTNALDYWITARLLRKGEHFIQQAVTLKNKTVNSYRYWRVEPTLEQLYKIQQAKKLGIPPRLVDTFFKRLLDKDRSVILDFKRYQEALKKKKK